ncbi:Bug family tripartite tricarboxylate transporter substrate binding protein [Pigmentiphaga litoralis]|uniref:Tripartite-type tricarboxylate transporter receptor subunit TctC n=1 Tax=Pigmentiphaga litoralis TaxID=516702 RepID=A0A7Y9IUK0_9BURK|nr:tripartite tricarboxylate transporter substrate binding protein [Pigmentiphaga litoralis]NYE23162.1 tripartite-type tricarboxylate transporter receptor subunit TctC [Pigmentiphaga litoralis]NYE83223.1 tripartite-type tricarboxylate transporter receptor subunit TctC [Pigmentiphaga litoralis]
MHSTTLTALFGATFCIAATGAQAAQADSFPNRPIRMIVAFSAGGSTDTVARYYAVKLGEVLKTNVIVENRPGAAQMIGINATLNAPADGYTIYLGTGSSLSQNPGVRTNLPYDPLKNFTLLGLVATTPGVIVVTPALPVQTFSELITYAKANPGKLNYGSSGLGSASHLQAEYFLSLTGVQATHIPFKADAEIMTAMSGNLVHLGIAPIQGAVGAIRTGKVRPLAITSATRIASLPDTPSVSELGFKELQAIDPYTYYGLVGPSGIPDAVVTKINAAINTVSAMPQTKELMGQNYFYPSTSTPESFRNYIAQDIAKWRSFSSKIKLD